MAEGPQHAPRERGFPGAEIAFEVDHHARLEHLRERGTQRERRVFVGKECAQHAAIIEG